MTLAKDYYLGGIKALRIYLGSNIVWPVDVTPPVEHEWLEIPVPVIRATSNTSTNIPVPVGTQAGDTMHLWWCNTNSNAIDTTSGAFVLHFSQPASFLPYRIHSGTTIITQAHIDAGFVTFQPVSTTNIARIFFGVVTRGFTVTNRTARWAQNNNYSLDVYKGRQTRILSGCVIMNFASGYDEVAYPHVDLVGPTTSPVGAVRLMGMDNSPTTGTQMTQTMTTAGTPTWMLLVVEGIPEQSANRIDFNYLNSVVVDKIPQGKLKLNYMNAVVLEKLNA